VLIVRATKKLLDRIGPPTLREGEHSSTILGEWYATALFWKPQVVLLVNEPTLLPCYCRWRPQRPCRPGSPSRSLRCSRLTRPRQRSLTRNCSTCETTASAGPPIAAWSAS